MAGRLDGTVALVTGASSGIGEATARRLASEGAAVAVVARRRDRLERLADEIEAKGGRALATEADLSRQDQAVAAVERAIGELGRLDIVVNNAGVAKPSPVVDASTQEWDGMVALNVVGVLYTTHAALPHLLAAAEDSPRGVADLVNISSTAGRVASAGVAVYSLTKAGLGAFSESLRQEVAGQHVRVSLVEPGPVNTEMVAAYLGEVAPSDPLARRFAGIEPLEAEDIADAVCYVVTRPRRVAVNEIMVRPVEPIA